MQPPTVMSIDVGGTGIKGALVDQHGAVQRESNRPTPVADGPDAVVAAVRAIAGELTEPGVTAAGVVVPGSVDIAAGVARYAANIGWRDVPLRDLLAADLGLPVVLEHDVRAAGVAEGRLGGADAVTDSLVVVIGTGIAGVVRATGLPVRGATDLAGEIGHIPVYPDGEQCACGQRGCLETYASAAAIARRYLAQGGSTASDTLEIVAALPHDPIAQQVWTDATRALGIALATYTMLLDPVTIVLGGGLAGAGDTLLHPVRAELEKRLTWRAAPTVTVSTLGSRAGQLGAALLAWDAVGRAQP